MTPARSSASRPADGPTDLAGAGGGAGCARLAEAAATTQAVLGLLSRLTRRHCRALRLAAAGGVSALLDLPAGDAALAELRT